MKQAIGRMDTENIEKALKMLYGLWAVRREKEAKLGAKIGRRKDKRGNRYIQTFR